MINITHSWPILAILTALSVTGCQRASLEVKQRPGEAQVPPPAANGTDAPLQDAVVIARISGMTGDAVPMVEWTASANATSYTVLIAQDESCAKTVKSYAVSRGTSLPLSDLADGAYFVCVFAVDATGKALSKQASGSAITLDKTPPGAFSITEPPVSTANKSPEIQWGAAADAARYDLVVARDPDCKDAVQKRGQLTDVKATIGPLALGTYHVCVTAIDAAGNARKATNHGRGLTIRKREMLYVANNDSCSVSQFEIDPTTGALTHVLDVPTGDATYPNSIVAGAGGKFLFAPLMGTHDVAVFQVDQETGVAKPSGTYAVSAKPRWIAAHPTLNVIYVAHNAANTLRAFRFDATTGALTGMTELAAGTATRSVFVSPDGKQVLVTSNWSGSVQSFPVDPVTGDISAGSTLNLPGDPIYVFVNRTSQSVYVADSIAKVWHLTLDSTSGALSTPAAPDYATSSDALFLAIEPSGRFLYASVNWNDGAIDAFKRDPVDGALTPIGHFDVGPAPGQPAFPASGKFMYVPSYREGLVYVYAIDPGNGSLTSLATSPAQPGSSGTAILEIP